MNSVAVTLMVMLGYRATADGYTYHLLVPGTTVSVTRSHAAGTEDAEYSAITTATGDYVQLVVDINDRTGQPLGQVSCLLTAYEEPLLVADDGVSSPHLLTLLEATEVPSDPGTVASSAQMGLFSPEWFDPCWWLGFHGQPVDPEGCVWRCDVTPNGCLLFQRTCEYPPEPDGFHYDCTCSVMHCPSGTTEYCICRLYAPDEDPAVMEVSCGVAGYDPCP